MNADLIATIIHELAHATQSNHHSRDFGNEMARIGAKVYVELDIQIGEATEKLDRLKDDGVIRWTTRPRTRNRRTT